MARLTDLPEWDQRRHLDKIRTLPDFGLTPYVPGPPLGERRVALVTTSGIHERGARPFEVGSADYRVIPGDTPPGDLVMSHISVNFDRTGFQEDVNVVFPLERLRELHKDAWWARSPTFTIRSWALRRSRRSSRRRASWPTS